LVIFDVDGTLVDSQVDILAAFAQAFASVGRVMPAPGDVMGIVGLSLDVAVMRLVPGIAPDQRDLMVEAYKDAYVALRAQVGAAQSSPLYPGARAVLADLQSRSNVILGIATGKSRRGLDKLIEGHGLQEVFMTKQVSDFHPSKPHPSMVLKAMADVGVGPDQTVMVGDTSFDMVMAADAGVTGIGVSWGYHPTGALDAAKHVIDRFDQLPPLLDDHWSL
jgi:phosphoglycolate phosphatase